LIQILCINLPKPADAAAAAGKGPGALTGYADAKTASAASSYVDAALAVPKNAGL